MAFPGLVENSSRRTDENDDGQQNDEDAKNNQLANVVDAEKDTIRTGVDLVVVYSSDYRQR